MRRLYVLAGLVGAALGAFVALVTTMVGVA